MPKQQQKQRHLAQHFLRDADLVRRLVRAAKINSADTVYEIGPGQGIITDALAYVAGQVVAVEKDPVLVRRLRERFRAHENVEIMEGDFLNFPIPHFNYKIFGNIPFNITAAIMRRILWEPPSPWEAYLIMQKEPAMKYAGLGGETLASLLAKPFLEFEILAHLRKTDFAPAPDVDSVLLRIARRPSPMLSNSDALVYRDFVNLGFAGWKPNLRTAYKRVLTYTQWKRLSRDIGFPINATPTELTFDQWLRLYKVFRKLSGI